MNYAEPIEENPKRFPSTLFKCSVVGLVTLAIVLYVLVVVLPKEMVEVPDFVGLHVYEAQAQLVGSDLAVEYTTHDGDVVDVDDAAAYRIDDQYPEPRTRIENGASVHLFIIEDAEQARDSDYDDALAERDAALAERQAVRDAEDAENLKRLEAYKAARDAERAEIEAAEALAGYITVRPDGDYGGMSESDVEDLRFQVVYKRVRGYFSSWWVTDLYEGFVVTYWFASETFTETGTCVYATSDGEKLYDRPYAVSYDKDGNVLSLEVDDAMLV